VRYLALTNSTCAVSSERGLRFSLISFDIAIEEIFPTCLVLLWFAGPGKSGRKDASSLTASESGIPGLHLPTA